MNEINIRHEPLTAASSNYPDIAITGGQGMTAVAIRFSSMRPHGRATYSRAITSNYEPLRSASPLNSRRDGRRSTIPRPPHRGERVSRPPHRRASRNASRAAKRRHIDAMPCDLVV
ncbi:hypothetical protein GSH03_23190 [Burkholderia pseudomallei]|nr:hypothetical protein [Burkholderia pseudomallei]